jgi:hypothetical protein
MGKRTVEDACEMYRNEVMKMKAGQMTEYTNAGCAIEENEKLIIRHSKKSFPTFPKPIDYFQYSINYWVIKICLESKWLFIHK